MRRRAIAGSSSYCFAQSRASPPWWVPSLAAAFRKRLTRNIRVGRCHRSSGARPCGPEWICVSMNPGDTSLPRASISRSKVPSKSGPTWTMNHPQRRPPHLNKGCAVVPEKPTTQPPLMSVRILSSRYIILPDGGKLCAHAMRRVNARRRRTTVHLRTTREPPHAEDRIASKEPAVSAPSDLPYSPGTRGGRYVFTAGQVALGWGGDVVGMGDVRAQTIQTLNNVRLGIEGGGATRDDVLKCNVYLKDMADFQVMNDEFAKFFPDNPPGHEPPCKRRWLNRRCW